MRGTVLVTYIAVESNSRLVEALVVETVGNGVVGVLVVAVTDVVVTDGVVVNSSVVLVALDGLEVVDNVVDAVAADVPLVNPGVVDTVGLLAAVTVIVMSVTVLFTKSGLKVVGVGGLMDEEIVVDVEYVCVVLIGVTVVVVVRSVAGVVELGVLDGGVSAVVSVGLPVVDGA